MADVTKINGYIIKDANAPHPSNAGSAGQVLKKTETGTEWANAPVPDWNQNDSTAADYVKNRPFYTGDPVETVLVEESTVEFTDVSGLYNASFPSTFEATIGETYKVYWDGTAYECVCASFQSTPVIGNLSIIDAGSNTGEPFLMGIMNGEGIQIITTNSSSSHTFSISRTDVPVVKIDKKYLVQPDWNQNDSTAADYVKNRTHYEESSYTDYVLNMDGTEILGLSIPEVGETMTVKINGVESVETVEAARSGAFGNYTYIGNVDYDALRRGRTGWLVAAISGGFTVGFAKPDTTISIETIVIHKIDPKYLPPSFKPDGKSYLTFSSPNSFILAVNDATKHWDGTLEYFTADRTWTVWDGTTTLSSVDNDGENVLYLRGTGNTIITDNNYNYRWVLTGNDIACIGNIENLLDYTTVASGEHPTMANSCYGSMFRGCTSLTKAPALPATTLANYCYANMFHGCTSLTQAPALPATTLADNCYYSMFRDCINLTQAPALPATTLANSCYYNMFNGCTSLTQAPNLPATTLVNSCYSNMFNGCTNLTTAPALPATTLANYCYDEMFRSCISLIQVPALPATTLADHCYYYMFYGCTSLKLSSVKTDEYTQEYRIPSSNTGTTASNALTRMFTSTGGTFTGTPEINTTYYLSSDNMIVRETEISTLNGYVGSMIMVSAIPVNEKGAANGVASLGSDGKVPGTQLPSLDYIPTSQKGVASGVASLGADGKVPSAQLPEIGGGTDIGLGVTGATVGQIAKITAVDGSGKPTAWEAVDMPSGGHWETVLDTVWEQDVINPTAFDSETGIFTCASGELNNLALNTEYAFFQQCAKEGVAYNTILNNENLKVTKLSDTTFSIDVKPPTTFVPTNVKFSRGECLAITNIDAKKIRLTLDGQFKPTATYYDRIFYGMNVTYFGSNTGYQQIRNAYQAYQQVTAEVESPYRIVGEILCGFNAPSQNASFHFKNNSFCCPLVPYNVQESNERMFLMTSDGTKIAKLYSSSSPWMLGGVYENTAILNDFLKIISGTKVKLERWVE